MNRPTKRSSRRWKVLAAAVGVALGAVAGYAIGLALRSDNRPFFLLMGALAGLCGGLLAGFIATRRWSRRR